jgi:hypothetical protein
VHSRSADIRHQQGKEQTPLTTKTTSIGSSKGNSIDEPQYEGNTIPLEAGHSPSTLGQGFITTLAISRALGGAGSGDGAALHDHSPARAWSLIQLRSWPISDIRG